MPPTAGPPTAIPADHWVYPLLDRMAASGLLDGVWLPGRRPVGAGAVGAALDTAATRGGPGSAWGRTARAARAWLDGEYGLGASRGIRGSGIAGGRYGDGPRTARSAGLLGARLIYRAGEDLSLWAEPVAELGAGGIELPTPRMGVAWRFGRLVLGASYDALRLGPAASGGIVVGGEAAMGGLELRVAEPVELPGLLRVAGPVQASVSMARIGADSLGPAVGFFTGELRVQPHPRVTFGVYRSSVLAWEVDGRHPGPLDLAGVLVGAHTPFDDQKASLSGSVRADVLGLTITPYAVWGFEDSAGIDEDPAMVVGAWLPSIPVAGLPFGARYEWTAFGRDAQMLLPRPDWYPRNWYRHSSGRSVYVDDDGTLLGHPLGGYGREHRLELSVAAAAGLMVRGGGFTRYRENAYRARNLLADVMPGRSRGGYLEAILLATGVRIEGALHVEDGTGWSRTEAAMLARILF